MRTCFWLVLFLSGYMLSTPTASAADTHEGIVVSADEGSGNTDGKLVMKDKDGKDEHTHMISSTAKIMREDKSAKLSELKKGDFIQVTTNKDGKVTEVAATQKSPTRNNDAIRTTGTAPNELPAFLKNVTLTAEQKEKINNICHECDGDREAAWKEFGDHYREAVGIEASMLVSIEDHLTDAQRKHMRHQRHRVSHGKHHAAKDSTKNSDENANRDSNNRNTNDSSKDAKDTTNSTQGNAQNPVVEEITVVGVTLSPDQVTATEGVHENYRGRLHRLHGQIAELHAKLIAMETHRLLQIEDVLTKEQRQQIRKDHQKRDRSGQHSANTNDSSN